MEDENGSAVARVDSLREKNPDWFESHSSLPCGRTRGGGGGGVLGRESKAVGGIGFLVPFGRPNREEDGKEDEWDSRRGERMYGNCSKQVQYCTRSRREREEGGVAGRKAEGKEERLRDRERQVPRLQSDARTVRGREYGEGNLPTRCRSGSFGFYAFFGAGIN